MAQAPRYRELADELRVAIFAGQTLLAVELVDGTQLPTEPELATHFQVSRGTIRQALRELAAEGLIETRGRSGTYVRRLPMLEYNADAENPHRRDDQPGTTDTWFSVVKRAGREPSQDFRFRIEPASAIVASRLGISINDLVVVRECQRYVNEVPWSEQVSYYPYDLAKKCGLDTPEDIPEGTVRRMAACGVVENRLDHEISSRPASDDERRHFDLAPGVSVLIYQRTALSEGNIVRYTREVLPADRNVITHTTASASLPCETGLVKIRRATANDLDTIVRWREQAASWLHEQGSDQWSDAGLTRDTFVHRVAESIQLGNTWIAEDDDATPLGTIAVDSISDPGLWTPAELEQAYVIHRMITDLSATGRGVGALMLNHAEGLARRDGRSVLILDAWTSNPGLHAYYESQGFRRVRTVLDHYTPSATLFERPVRAG